MKQLFDSTNVKNKLSLSKLNQLTDRSSSVNCIVLIITTQVDRILKTLMLWLHAGSSSRNQNAYIQKHNGDRYCCVHEELDGEVKCQWNWTVIGFEMVTRDVAVGDRSNVDKHPRQIRTREDNSHQPATDRHLGDTT